MKFGGGASRKLSLSFLLFYLFCSWTVSYASSITERETLTDGWGGVQKALEDNGLTIGLAYVADMGSVTGGAEDKSFIYLDNVDITFTVDTEKAGLWHGGTFFVYILSNHGDNPSRYAGDIQVTSNIESQDSTRLYEFWYEQSFMDGDLSVLGGLHDLNSEFLVTEYGGLFLNSSFGIQPNVSANAPVSIFNVTSPAIRVKGKVTNAITLLAGIYDGGVGYPEGNPNGLDLKIDPDNEGVFSIVEADFKTGQGKDKITSLPGVYKVGAWRHTGHFAKHLNSGASSGNNGFYFIADQMVYREYGNQGLGIFLQYGVAPNPRARRRHIRYRHGEGACQQGFCAGFGCELDGRDYNRNYLQSADLPMAYRSTERADNK